MGRRETAVDQECLSHLKLEVDVVALVIVGPVAVQWVVVSHGRVVIAYRGEAYSVRTGCCGAKVAGQSRRKRGCSRRLTVVDGAARGYSRHEDCGAARLV